MIFPTDLASFLELLRLHGDEAYGLIFAFAASYSLLLTLFAGYAFSSGALHLGTLIAFVWAGSFLGDAIRFWIGRCFGRPCVWPNLGEAVKRCFLWYWHGHADCFPRTVVDPK